MSFANLLDLKIADIDIPANRARDYDQDGAEALAAIIREQGLFHPISVRRVDDRYRLVSGLHRLRAFEINGETTIPARLSTAENDDTARLEEVMENLGRNELIALDRCHHLYELKQVWVALHPEFANGGGKTFPTGNEVGEIFGFASETAERLSLSKRAINMAVKIWTDLAPSSRSRLSGTDLAHKQTELKALSEQKPAIQAKILDLILGQDQPEVQNVAGALGFLEGGVQPTTLEKRYRAVSDGIRDLSEPSLDRLIVENEERILGSLKRLGRI